LAGKIDRGGEMQKIGETLNLSAGDLVGHLNCSYLTQLDLKVATGELEKPKVWDPVLETLLERGALHEQGFIDHIKMSGLAVSVIDGVGIDSKSVAATHSAMTDGEPIIVQGAFEVGRWNGRTDVLRRVETPSRFGAWSYEVIDTKLARETKGNTILQISLYSDLLFETQGAKPVSAYVVTPGTNYTPEATKPGKAQNEQMLSALPPDTRRESGHSKSAASVISPGDRDADGAVRRLMLTTSAARATTKKTIPGGKSARDHLLTLFGFVRWLG
jgi:hypothetical protein